MLSGNDWSPLLFGWDPNSFALSSLGCMLRIRMLETPFLTLLTNEVLHCSGCMWGQRSSFSDRKGLTQPADMVCERKVGPWRRRLPRQQFLELAGKGGFWTVAYIHMFNLWKFTEMFTYVKDTFKNNTLDCNKNFKCRKLEYLRTDFHVLFLPFRYRWSVSPTLTNTAQSNLVGWNQGKLMGEIH